MSLIAMAVYSTEENHKDECLFETLRNLSRTVHFSERHRLILSVNAETRHTKEIIEIYGKIIENVIYNDSNLGTAEALNKVIKLRKPREYVIKIDDDVIVNQGGWVEEMEEAINRDPQIGIVGLKRKDLIQSPYHPDPQFNSELILLPHKPGESWIVVERTADIIGTCTMFNPLLLDKIGYSRQPGKYGFEDSLFCHRSHLAGFYNCFLSHIKIDHIDNTPTPYTAWKQSHSSDNFKEYHRIVHAMIAGTEPIYYNPFECTSNR